MMGSNDRQHLLLLLHLLPLILLLSHNKIVYSFCHFNIKNHNCMNKVSTNNNQLQIKSSQNNDNDNDIDSNNSRTSQAQNEAAKLLERSRLLREEIAKQESNRKNVQTTTKTKTLGSDTHALTVTNTKQISKWSIPFPSSHENNKEEDEYIYRLYVDIGREDGTWMEPRWGASGKRIEFTLDIQFRPGEFANDQATKLMVQDNRNGKSSPTYIVQSAPYARLRGGFDQMECEGGAFRIDNNTRNKKAGQSDTVRFYIIVNGIGNDGSYGDVSIPQGGLYFSIPCFGGSCKKLSTKGEWPVTVLQMGWHTGWRRQESRIVGIFRAVPINEARKKKDGF